MTKREVKPADCAGAIIEAIPKGVLLNTMAGEKLNSMIIGWGTFGVEWGVPIFAVYVREGRFTRHLLDENPAFTVSIPWGEATADHRRVLQILGGTSGRDRDKILEAGLTPVLPTNNTVPGIREYPLTLECRVVFRQRQDLENIDARFQRAYPQDVPSDNPMANKDPHIAYYGEIVGAYVIED